MGITKDNIPTGGGILKENNKNNKRVNRLEDRLRKIEEWEIATNYLVNSIVDTQKNMLIEQAKSTKAFYLLIKIISGLCFYVLLKDLGNTSLANYIINILSKIL